MVVVALCEAWLWHHREKCCQQQCHHATHDMWGALGRKTGSKTGWEERVRTRALKIISTRGELVERSAAELKG